jgi:hypothetical protein
MDCARESFCRCAPRYAFGRAGLHLAAVSLLSLAGLVATGCSDPPARKLALGDPCDPSRPTDCADSLCIPLDDASGFCARSCGAEGACPEGFRCEDAGRFGPVCQRASTCDENRDCPSGHRCDLDSGVCYIKVVRELCSPCTTDKQCPEDGTCFSVPATGERYCTTSCGEGGSCPEGYACKEVPLFKADGAVELTKQCVPDNPGGTCEGGGSLCAPCKGDQECGGPFDQCVRNVVSGETFCGRVCDPARTGDCPEGFGCLDMSGVGDGPFQCVPNSNSCRDFCDSSDERAQILQCGLGRQCDVENHLCRSADDGRQCSPCRDNDDCRRAGRESNECLMNACEDCPSKGETFCAEPCPTADGDKQCQERFGPGFVCAPVGQGQFCVPQRGTCLSGLGRLGDSCSAGGASDCVTGLCLSYGSTALCSASCALDGDCGDPRKWRCCARSGDFYDCSPAERNSADNGPKSGLGVCAPNGGLFGDDCSPGRPPCQSGTCLDIGTARLCSTPCAADGTCPPDFVCRDAFAESDGSPVRICFPDGGGAPGSDCSFGPAACADRLCIKKASGAICTQPCGEGGACPDDWACSSEVMTVTGELIEACVPPELQ